MFKFSTIRNDAIYEAYTIYNNFQKFFKNYSKRTFVFFFFPFKNESSHESSHKRFETPIDLKFLPRFSMLCKKKICFPYFVKMSRFHKSSRTTNSNVKLTQSLVFEGKDLQSYIQNRAPRYLDQMRLRWSGHPKDGPAAPYSLQFHDRR